MIFATLPNPSWSLPPKDQSISASHAAMNATPLQQPVRNSRKLQLCARFCSDTSADRKQHAHPVGASLAFLLSSVRAVVYKLQQDQAYKHIAGQHQSNIV